MKKNYQQLPAKLPASRIKQISVRAFPFLVTLLLAAVSPHGLFAQAPTIGYSSPQSYTIGRAITPLAPTSSGVAAFGYSTINIDNPFYYTGFAATDAAGNAYVVGLDIDEVYKLEKIPAGSTVPVVIDSFDGGVTAFTLDAAGNVYVACSFDFENPAVVYKYPTGGGPRITVNSAGLGASYFQLIAIAVDNSGNIYAIIDDGGAIAGTRNALYKIESATGNTVKTDLGFKYPQGLTTDAAGNLYVADLGNNLIKKVPVNGGPVVMLGAGLGNPTSVAVDAAGNVYFTDRLETAVPRIPVTGGAPVTIANAPFRNSQITVGNAGNLYLAGNSYVEIIQTGGYFINSMLPAGLNFNNTTGTISGTPTVLSAPKTYTISAYNSFGHAATTLNLSVVALGISYVNPPTYTVGSAITPLSPSVTGGPVDAPAYNSSTVSAGANFSGPNDVAVDAANNVYVADYLNNAVKMIPATGGAPVTLGSGFNQPAGISVDAAGNVYVADYGNNAVKKIPVGGGSPVTIGSGFLHPYDVATDAAGNIYVSDYGHNAIKKIPKAGGTPVTVGSGFNQPTCIAADAAGNVYVADEGNNAIKKIPVGGGSILTLGSGFLDPIGVAVDGAGNIFVGDYGNHAVKELRAAGGPPLSIGSNFNGPTGLAADLVGNVYVADYSNNAVEKIIPSGGYYISASLPAGLSFDNATGVISGTPTAASATKNYFIAAYNFTGASLAFVTITVNPVPPVISYASPQVYHVGTAITPLAPTSSRVAAAAYSKTPLAVGSGFNQPGGIVADAAGYVYVADGINNVVKMIPLGGGTPVTLAAGFNLPAGMAIDAAGNIYVADFGNNAVKKIPVGGGSPVTIGTGFNQPTTVAVDAAGNVYVVDSGNSQVKEIPVGGGAQSAIGSGFQNPFGVAVDPSGNLYITDRGSKTLKTIPAAGGVPVTLATGFSIPSGVAIDPAGNLFVTDEGNNSVKEIPAGGGTAKAIGAGFNKPAGVTIDALGEIYIADKNNNAVKKVIPVGGYYISAPLPAGLSFSSATGIISGTPTMASPGTNYMVSAYNAGGYGWNLVNVRVNPGPPTVTYTSPQTYFIGVPITPLAPVSNGVAAPAYNHGVAVVGSGFSLPDGVAADAAGNVYVSDVGHNVVWKVPAGGGAQVSWPGFTNPRQIAIDRAGNVYIADQGNNIIKEIPVGGGALFTIGSGFSFPAGVAVDDAGNIYVSDTGNNLVKEIPAGGGSPVTIGSGFSSPQGIAVDAAGNVYVADYSNNVIKKIPAGGVPVVIASGFANPSGVAVDPAGNIFVAEKSTGRVKEIPASGGSQVIIASGFTYPMAVAIDGLGNVLAADELDDLVMKIVPVGGYYISSFLPAGLNFDGATGIISGTPVTSRPATNYAVTAYNLGGGNTANVNIKVTAEADANLANLTISSGTLTPVFGPNTTSYTASVSNAISSITLTPTTSDAKATVQVNGAPVTSGTACAAIPLSPGINTITTIVTASDGTTSKNYTVTVTRAASANANLTNLKINSGTVPLTPAFNYNTFSYTASVTAATTNIKITPAAADANATIKINGTTVASGTASAALPLSAGSNTITTIVTAQDGTTTKTYTITVTRAPSPDANLAALALSSGTLAPVFAAGTTSYTTNVAYATSTITVTPTTDDPTATVTVNGTAVTSGTASAGQPLAVGQNAITTVVTAKDGTTTKTYTITVTRAPSNDANLSNLKINSGTIALTPAFNYNTTNYTASVPATMASIKVIPAAADANATIKINGATVASGTSSASLTLVTGPNTITTVVTAQDGTTTKTYTVTVTRPAGPMADPLAALSVEQPIENPGLETDGIVVHQGLSPNGDGQNDYLVIEGISNYPENKLMIMNRSGQLIYEAKGYDNSSRVFDGHSNKTGAKQLPGTYFYSLVYRVKGVIKYKAGFMILKY